jgi:hypothetical protein
MSTSKTITALLMFFMWLLNSRFNLILINVHRWARLLKQQTSFTVYRLPSKENKHLFSIPVCSAQMEVAIYVRSIFRLRDSRNVETWTKRYGDMKTWRQGDKETWRQGDNGDMETLRHGDMETRRHGDTETRRHGETETQRHGDTEPRRHGDMETSNGKRKPMWFSLIRLPFAHRANGLLTKK